MSDYSHNKYAARRNRNTAQYNSRKSWQAVLILAFWIVLVITVGGFFSYQADKDASNVLSAPMAGESTLTPTEQIMQDEASTPGTPVTPAPQVGSEIVVAPEVVAEIPVEREQVAVEIPAPSTPPVVTPPVVTPPVAGETDPAQENEHTLRYCEQEDSEDCYWDAKTQGNGTGTSFVNINGSIYYLP